MRSWLAVQRRPFLAVVIAVGDFEPLSAFGTAESATEEGGTLLLRS